MQTYADIFGGFGGASVGAINAGLRPIWTIEIDPAVAEVNRANLGHEVIVADILTIDPSKLEAPTIFHASPPCPNFSLAKTGAVETALDIALARKTADFVTTLKPQVFTLENVYAYRNSKSWTIIEDALWSAGYWLSVEHVNAANFGVPQTRKRMIVRAVRGGFVPYLPEPKPWVGWYAAVADLIDTLPESQFAPWQMKRLPQLLQTTLIGAGGFRDGITMAQHREPSMTVTSNENMLTLRAWLVDGNNSTNGQMTIRNDPEPAFTVTSGGSKNPIRSLLNSGRVVSLTPRALARFQSFPDWYSLPSNARLAAKGIGNAVCPLMYQRIIEPLKEAL